MAGNLFKKAAAYRKKHKGMSMQAAVKAIAKKNKPARKKKAAAVGKVRKKKAASTRKVKIKAKKGTTRITIGKARKSSSIKKILKSVGIGSVNMSEIRKQHDHQHSLQSAINRHTAALKVKGTTPAEKRHLRAEIKKYKHSLASSKRHVSQLKRHI